MGLEERAGRGMRAWGAGLGVVLVTAAAATGAVLVGGGGANAAEPVTVAPQIINKFKAPDVNAKPMARMWFPDAGAGASAEGLALVAKQINEMATGGFGGVEISYLADSSSYTNADAKTIGFGSKNWQNILKQLLKTANAVPGGFKIDLTITSHWPPIVNLIDPNDDEQQQEAVVATKKITAADLATGKVTLALPTTRTRDFSNTTGLIADFVFADKLRAATLAKVVSMSGTTPVFQVASLADVTGATSKIKNADGSFAGTAAGVPDQAYATAHGLNYTTVLNQWGPEPSDPSFTGKIDADGNRRRMADWQYNYATDLGGLSSLQGYTPSDGTGWAVGDYALLGTYSRGTGQIMSGGASVTQYNRPYATDYFSSAGAQKIIDFWNKNILDDELTALLKENGAKNGTSIFEDSIEIHHDNPLWTANLLGNIKTAEGYDASKYAPILAQNASTQFDDQTTATRVKEDYNLTLGGLYETDHATPIHDWTKTFNYTYRAQGYSLTGLDIAGAAAALDIPEGDNSTAGDGLRNLAAAVNLGGKPMLSMESFTDGGTLYTAPWVQVLRANNGYISSGVNRNILHGSPFARTFNGTNNAWPGWSFLNTFSAFNARQTYWSDVDTFSGYLARTQAVQQNGKANVDLAVLIGTNTGFGILSGNSLQSLLNRGYSYNILSEALLKQPNAVVTDGKLAASGPAYRALIVRQATQLQTSSVQKLIDYAKGGLPVILYGTNVTRIYGTNKDADNDTLLAAKLAELQGLPNVKTAATQDDILALLGGANVNPAASYNVSGLEVSHRVAPEGDFYYLYNNNAAVSTTLNQPAAAGATGVRLTSTSGIVAGDALIIGSGINAQTVKVASIPSPAPASPSPNVTLTAPLGAAVTSGSAVTVPRPLSASVTLAGTGRPYELDAYTGAITPIADYTVGNGSVTVPVKLEARDATIIAVASDAASFPAVASPLHAAGASGGDVVYSGSGIAHRAYSTGTYSVPLSNGTTATVAVPSIPSTILLNDGWDLSLESWGPQTTGTGAGSQVDPRVNPSVDPTLSAKTTVPFNGIALASWSAIPATSGQLTTLGIANMGKVSGIGTYTKTFDLPAGYRASLKLAHGVDMIAEVTINGTKIDNVDQFTDTVDVGPYLKAGANTLSIKVDTTLNNRVNTTVQAYGLTGVQLVPYVDTPLGTSITGTVGGSVPATLSLALGTTPSFGAFTPGVDRNYDASTAATVISTAGDATLSVADPSATATGRLVNGAFALSEPLQAKANASAFSPLSTSGAPLSLLTYTGPVGNDAVTIGFRQHVAAGQALRTGSYGKTLTFTLSTTTP